MANFQFDGSISPNAAVVSVVKDVVAGTTASISVGDLFRTDDGNPGYVKLGANGDTDTLTLNRVYLCTKASDETAGVDGTVQGIWCPFMRLLGTATTPGNLAQSVIDTRVTLDLSGSTQTIDENDTTNGFMRIVRPATGYSEFDTTNGLNVAVVVNECVT